MGNIPWFVTDVRKLIRGEENCFRVLSCIDICTCLVREVGEVHCKSHVSA